jgi:hypothetical protein
VAASVSRCARLGFATGQGPLLAVALYQTRAGHRHADRCMDASGELVENAVVPLAQMDTE